MSVRTVPLTMPEEVWGRLASLADRRGVSVADLVADTVGALVRTVEVGRAVGYEEGDTGAPGHRLAILHAEVSAARRAGYRTPQVRRAS